MSALERLLREGDDDDIRRFFNLLRPPELADVLEQLPDDTRLRAIRLMGPPLAAEVLHSVEEPDQKEIMEDLSASERAEIVKESMSDDAADLLEPLSEAERSATLERLDPEDREEIKGLLEYGDETAGGLMQTELVTVRGRGSVDQALQAVRESHIEDVGEIHEVFVVDADGRLVGSISPADLLQADPAANLREIIEPNPVSVPVTMDQEQIAEVAREHDLATIPVVDAQGVLVGQILHDDIADVIEEEATEDIARMAGHDPDEVYFDSVWLAVRSRIPWLLPTFVGGALVAFFMKQVEDDIRKAEIVAAYLVIVVGMAGGVGTQNAAITARSLALGRVGAADLLPFVRRQLTTGVVLGTLYASLLFVVAWFMHVGDPGAVTNALALSIAILIAMVVGAGLGAFVPLGLARFGFDPAAGASPLITTVNDVVGAGILYWSSVAFGIIK